jgi:hypothetical protein
MTAQLIDLDRLPASPWKNGGGSTRQLAIHPPQASLDDFVWRISCARVNGAGPFSAFPGIQRSLALLEGELLLQRQSGITTLCAGGEALDFPGEEPISATPLAGEVLDLNLMSRRDEWQQELSSWLLHGEMPLAELAEVRLLLCSAGLLRVRLQDGRTFSLHPRQALLLNDEPCELHLHGQQAHCYLGLLRRLS